MRATRERPRAIAALAFGLAGALAPSGCTCSGSTGADASSTSAPTATATATASASAGPTAGATSDGDVKPVYPMGGPPHPIATRVCALLYGRVEAKRVACCKRPAGGDASVRGLEAECSRMLAAALGDASVSVEAAAIDACEAALEAELAPCDWMTPQRPALPAACRALVTGALPAGKRCRSSLECSTGLTCRGVGPTQPGTCAPPGKQGSACGLAVDALASYVGADAAEHPECEGFCERRYCVAPVAVGGACKTSLECARGAACDKGACVKLEGPGPLAEGALCVDGRCAAGLACVAGRCVKKKAQGEPCTSGAECRAACVAPKRGAPGACGTQCGL